MQVCVWFETWKIWHTGGDCLYSQWQWLIRWDSTPKVLSICRVSPRWFAFNESVVCLKWHEPIPLKTFVVRNQWQKKVYFHSLQFPIIILAKGAGVLVFWGWPGAEKTFSTWFSLRLSFLQFWVFTSSSYNRQRCVAGLITSWNKSGEHQIDRNEREMFMWWSNLLELHMKKTRSVYNSIRNVLHSHLEWMGTNTDASCLRQWGPYPSLSPNVNL